MKDSKYLVWKRDEMENWMSERATEGLPSPVPDAVVIRRQDVFAPPALDAYANAMQCVIEAFSRATSGTEIIEPNANIEGDDSLSIYFTPSEIAKRLQEVADYFHQQAALAYEGDRKFPD